jgi:hypothetical protein
MREHGTFSRRPWALVLGLLGVGLLASVVMRLGPDRIIAELQGLSRILPLVLALTGPKYVLQAAGWRTVLPPAMRPSWTDSIAATVTGDALGYLTWAGPFTGEPIRAMLTRHAAPVGVGTAAGAAERLMYNVTAAALVVVVLVAAAIARGHLAEVVSWTAGVTAVVWLVIVGTRRSVREDRRPRAPSRFAGRFRQSVEALGPFWSRRRRLLPLLATLCLLQHALLVAEGYAMLSALGADPSVTTALVFEAVTKLVNTAGILVPGRIGISEAGSAVLAGSLGFAASYGLSLALMRRLRALLWAAVGLALLPVTAWRAQRARS